MTTRPVDGLRGRTALVLCHCAGLMDIAALPVWVGMVLIGRYGLDPQRAGALATLFLAGVVASSLFFAPRVGRLRGEIAAPVGFALAAAAFFALSATTEFGAMAILHGLGGLAVGCGLSFTHSTMGASGNPHRLVAIGFAALSLLSLVFLSTMPRHVHSTGGPVLFVVLGSIMLVAALAATAWFPPPESAGHREVRQEHTPIPRGVWFAMAGISFMTLNQAMMFSFLERMGVARGFSQQELMRMLLLCGVVNLFPAILAAAMERRLSSRAVMLAGPALQGSLGLVITQSPVFAPYAVAASVYVATLIFTHTFVFGFLARSDRSTRAVAATPVMTMAGSAMGPFVGGAVAQNLGGYSSIGWAATIVSILGVYCFWQAHRGLVAAPRSIDPRADLAGPGVR